MDEYSIGDLINNENIDISRVYGDTFIIAVNWTDKYDLHFKMFKKLSFSQVINFSYTLENSWNIKINDWLISSRIPLKLDN